ncbi:MAG: nuclear transport factor 2 family protein [Bacteroidetes bacterium]|nr:nuclear transport factor 2 family protein [Bacteroidota bacterium]
MNRKIKRIPVLIFLLLATSIEAANIYKEETMTKAPEQIIEQQLKAYNAGDIDSFMESFHPEIKVYNYPDELIFDTKEAKREAYEKMFKKFPNNHAEIVERMTFGNFVIDKEKVTGRGEAPPMYVIAMYEVKDELIYRVTFLREK